MTRRTCGELGKDPTPFELWKALLEEYARLRDHARTSTILGVAAMAGIVAANNSIQSMSAILVCAAIIVMVVVHTLHLQHKILPRQKYIAQIGTELERLLRPTIASHQLPLLQKFSLFGQSAKSRPDSNLGSNLLSVVFIAAGMVAIGVIAPGGTTLWFMLAMVVALPIVLLFVPWGYAISIPEQETQKRPGGDSNARPAA